MAILLDPVEELERRVDSPNDPAHSPLFHVVLLNDDYHTYDYIIEMLGRLFFITPARSFRHAVEIDTTGRSIVITCELEQAEFARDQIHGYGRDHRVESCRGSMSAVIEPAGPPK